MSITTDEIEREKKTLPFGWGRFGKTLDRLAEISEPEESLLASCVAMNPEYQQTIGPALGAGRAAFELTKATNVVLACTDRRLIVIPTGVGGAPREHRSIPYDGLDIVSRKKRLFVLAWPGGRMRIRGTAKGQDARFLDALAARARPAEADQT